MQMNFEEKISKYVNRNVLYAKPEATLGEVASLMAQKGTDVAVVRSNDAQVIGLITAQELFYALRAYVLGKDFLENIKTDLRDIRVKEMMRSVKALDFMDVCSLTGTKVCIGISENETVANAIRVLSMAGITHLLINDKNGVIGTLCAEDLVKAFI